MRFRWWLQLAVFPVFALRLPAQPDRVDDYIQREMAARKIPGLAPA